MVKIVKAFLENEIMKMNGGMFTVVKVFLKIQWRARRRNVYREWKNYDRYGILRRM